MVSKSLIINEEGTMLEMKKWAKNAVNVALLVHFFNPNF